MRRGLVRAICRQCFHSGPCNEDYKIRKEEEYTVGDTKYGA